MSSPTLPTFTADQNGIQIQTMQEIIDELVAGYKVIYGSDIDVNPNTPDGQRIGIEAKARLDMQSFGALLYNQLDPDLSMGTFLDKIIKFSGITRSPATQSTVVVTIVTDRNLTLPINYIVTDALAQNWITTTTLSLTTGSNTVTLKSQDFAAITAAIGTVTSPATIVLGVISVTNPAIASVGSDEETDQQLRIRRNLSLSTPATSSVGGLYTAIADIASVNGLKIYENNTDTTDSNTVPPHSIWCIIDGGSLADIAQTLVMTKNCGTGMKGSISETYVETITLPITEDYPVARTFYYNHIMKFDRPIITPIWVFVNVTSTNGSLVDAVAIADDLAALVFTIGESIYCSDLYSTVYGNRTGFFATSLTISLDSNPAHAVSDILPPIASLQPQWLITIPVANVTVSGDV